MKTITTIILACCYLSVNAQINIPVRGFLHPHHSYKQSKENIDSLKETTTLFTLQYRDYETLAAYEKAISEVWTITKFKIIKPDEVSAYTGKKGYSFFTFDYKTSIMGNKYSSNTVLSFFYDLWTPETHRKGKKKKQHYYSRILLSPDIRDEHDVRKLAADFDNDLEYRQEHDPEKEVNTYMNNGATFYDWDPGLLKEYLKTINDMLTGKKDWDLVPSSEDRKALGDLKTDTLYIPDYLLHFYQARRRIRKYIFSNEDKERNLETKYPYPVKFISLAELNDMLLNAKKPFCFLLGDWGYQFMNICRSDRGVIFERDQWGTAKFRRGDMAFLARAIQKEVRTQPAK